MTLYTIGFGHKGAEEFFTLLAKNGIRRVIDIRLNNTSQLAGYTKKADLEYFLRAILNVGYIHMPQFAPSEELFAAVKAKKVGWPDFEREYIRLVEARRENGDLAAEFFDRACLLCSEPTANNCHRRLLAEYLAARLDGLQVVHL